MILILGEEIDVSTFHVIDYLNTKRVNYLILNENDILEDVAVKISDKGLNVLLSYNTKALDSSELRSYWYRRGSINKKIQLLENTFDKTLKDNINTFLRNESKSFFMSANRILERIPVKIGAFSNHDLEKIFQLEEAFNCGIKVPASLICSQKSELIPFLKEHKTIATKGIKNSFVSSGNNESNYCAYTAIIDDNNIDLLSNLFAPTLFQNYLEKKYELRIFYLKGKCYSMAIFSQQNKKTQVDFRRYDTENPNRNVPYNLPKNISEKIDRLMQNLGLDTGSIDMIYTEDNEYVFLEVNPDGQFGMVSLNCNYFIEKDIANILSPRHEFAEA